MTPAPLWRHGTSPLSAVESIRWHVPDRGRSHNAVLAGISDVGYHHHQVPRLDQLPHLQQAAQKAQAIAISATHAHRVKPPLPTCQGHGATHKLSDQRMSKKEADLPRLQIVQIVISMGHNFMQAHTRAGTDKCCSSGCTSKIDNSTQDATHFVCRSCMPFRQR